MLQPTACQHCTTFDPSIPHTDIINGCRACGYVSSELASLLLSFQFLFPPNSRITPCANFNPSTHGWYITRQWRTFVEKYPSLHEAHECKKVTRQKKTVTKGTNQTAPSNKRYHYVNPDSGLGWYDEEEFDDADDGIVEIQEEMSSRQLQEVSIMEIITPERKRHGISKGFHIVSRPRNVITLNEKDTINSLPFPPLSSPSLVHPTLDSDWEFVVDPTRPAIHTRKGTSRISYARAITNSMT